MLSSSMWPVVIVFLVAAAACGSDGETAVEIDRNETVPVHLAITMKGDINVSFAETVSSYFIVRRTKGKSDAERQTQVIGVEPTSPIKYGAAAFLAGVGVTPYVGDGTYTIPTGSPIEELQKSQKTGTQPNVTSSIKVDWWPSGQVETDPEGFMRRAKPCRVVIKNNGSRGTLTCPDVTNEAQDKHFSLTLDWTAPVTN
jgi:hypothetical protein